MSKIYTISAIAIFITVAVFASVAMFMKKPIQAVVLEKPTVSTTTVVATTVSADEINTNEFAIAAYKLEQAKGSSLVYVTGKLRNLAGRQRFGIKLAFDLFDANDTPIGKATDYHPMFEPHTDWTFKALVLDSKSATARFNSIREEQ